MTAKEFETLVAVYRAVSLLFQCARETAILSSEEVDLISQSLWHLFILLREAGKLCPAKLGEEWSENWEEQWKALR